MTISIKIFLSHIYLYNYILIFDTPSLLHYFNISLIIVRYTFIFYLKNKKVGRRGTLCVKPIGECAGIGALKLSHRVYRGHVLSDVTRLKCHFFKCVKK